MRERGNKMHRKRPLLPHLPSWSLRFTAAAAVCGLRARVLQTALSLRASPAEMAARKRENTVNFSPGPAALPDEVVLEAQENVLNFKGLGVGVMELSHRSPEYTALNQQTQDLLRILLHIPSNYHVLFQQGGGTAQFSAIPLNLTPTEDSTADYFITGVWSQKAAKEAGKYLKVNPVLPKVDTFTTIVEKSQWNLTPGAGYVYYCANETVHGVEFPETPDVGSVPLVCDASSNFLTRPIDIAKHAVVYAGAQKNVGCAGVTVVIVRDDVLGKCRPYTPVVLDYTTTAKAKSVYNTPPVWSVYILNLVLQWIQKQGGVEVMERNRVSKFQNLMKVIDQSGGFYHIPVERPFCSHVNIPFRVTVAGEANPDLEAKFLSEAAELGLVQLKGHRSVGGIRVCLYNAISCEDVKQLTLFMKKFMLQNRN